MVVENQAGCGDIGLCHYTPAGTPRTGCKIQVGPTELRQHQSSSSWAAPADPETLNIAKHEYHRGQLSVSVSITNVFHVASL